MPDVLMKLARVNTLKAQDASNALNDLADEQEVLLGKKKELRAIQQRLTSIKADGSVSADELRALKDLMKDKMSFDSVDKALSADGSMREGDNFILRSDDTSKDAKVKAGNAQMDNIKGAIEAALADATDNEAMLQFHIQVGTGDMNNAESERASVTKILYEHRRDLANKWGG